MIAAVNEVVMSNKSDFYKYDLHALSDLKTPEFFWSVYEYGTQLLIIDRNKMLERLHQYEEYRFSFMQHPNLPLCNFLYFRGVKTFHHNNGIMSEIENPKYFVSSIWDSVSKFLQEVTDKEFGDNERKYWKAPIRVSFASPQIWRSVYKAIHKESGDSLLRILKSFKRQERRAVDERIEIAGDLYPNAFSFYHERNGKCIMNGGILFYNGKWHKHT